MAERPDRRSLVSENSWGFLRRFTNARIALGRAGVSLPTVPHLAFQAAHALARDAVHARLDTEHLVKEIEARGFDVVRTQSAAADRATYLQRPDLGRRLGAIARKDMEAMAFRLHQPPDVVFVIADGLSATAVQRHAVPLLDHIAPSLRHAGLRPGPIVVVEQGRVAIADEIGEVMGASIAVLLVGERPGLSSPDSLGVYLTYDPRVGRSDAERNCISNIHRAGLSYEAAAYKLVYLLTESLRRKLSGVGLKDEAPEPVLEQMNGVPPRINFLIDGRD